MITLFKLYESKDNMEVLARNISYYSWEYDNYTATAEILLDRDDNSLYLKINDVHVKSGLGAGTFPKDLVFVKIGDLNKADLKLVRTLLAEHGYSQRKFSTHWEDLDGNKLTLSELLQEYKPEKPEKVKNIEKKLKHIEPISSFEDKVKKDIEIVKYSDKSYALFGKDTIKIKDDLIKLGCRYNKFLTDPKSGEKRAGWIFSNNKLNLIQELIK